VGSVRDQFSGQPRYRIPFIDLKAIHKRHAAELEKAVTRVMRRQWYVLGPELEAFEREFAASLGAPYCVGVGSGFDALKLALLALDLGPDDEVVLPANTFVATYMSVVASGARPVLCDVERETQNVSVESMRRAVTTRTRALIPVHLYGNPCPMDEISAFAKQRGLFVVEDAAQAHGARFAGRAVGTFGDYGAFSFYPGKNLGSFGDGGAIVCRSKPQLRRLLRLRNYGFETKNRAISYGENSRLDELHAAVLRVKLGDLDEVNEIRNRNASHYRSSLGPGFAAQRVLPGAESCYDTYVIRLRNRDEVLARLRAARIEAMIHYPWPVHRQPAYKKLSGGSPTFPVAEKLSKQVLSLPVDLHMNRPRIEEVAEIVRRSAGG